jgi:hypothetical protein
LGLPGAADERPRNLGTPYADSTGDRGEDAKRNGGKDEVVEPCEALAEELLRELFPKKCEDSVNWASARATGTS